MCLKDTEIKRTEHVKAKLVRSGDVYEIYFYEKGYWKGFSKGKREVGRKKNFVSDDYEENRSKALKRTQQRLRRLINANVWRYGEISPKFLTLTFKENITCTKEANDHWMKFIKRLNYNIFKSKKAVLKYSVVVEFQKRGAVHYHAIFYNLPFVDASKLSDIWGHGFIKINRIDNVDNIGAYVTKYLSKNKGQGLEEKKSNFSSRGLIQPKEITDKEKVAGILESLPLNTKVFESSFNNEHLGDVTYYQYNLSRVLKSREEI